MFQPQKIKKHTKTGQTNHLKNKTPTTTWHEQLEVVMQTHSFDQPPTTAEGLPLEHHVLRPRCHQQMARNAPFPWRTHLDEQLSRKQIGCSPQFASNSTNRSLTYQHWHWLCHRVDLALWLMKHPGICCLLSILSLINGPHPLVITMINNQWPRLAITIA